MNRGDIQGLWRMFFCHIPSYPSDRLYNFAFLWYALFSVCKVMKLISGYLLELRRRFLSSFKLSLCH